MNKKRKLKTPAKRRGLSNRLGTPEMYRKIEDKTGFRRDDIKLVIDALMEVIIEGLVSKRTIEFNQLGLIWPRLKASRVGMAFGGKNGVNGKKMIVPARYVASFQMGTVLNKRLKEVIPTQEDIDAQYED